jgi:diacylglycerol kinase
MQFDVGRIVSSFGFAGSGFVHLWKTQNNARVHGIATVLIVAIAVWLQLAPHDAALLVFAIALVWAAEAMNTAIEATVDLVTEERRPLARIAKDTAAAAVLVCAFGAAVVGALILGPALYGRWHAP